MTRLNIAAGQSGMTGFFFNHSAYAQKTWALNEAIKGLKSAQGNMDSKIIEAVNDKDSALYKALNTHTSVFKFNATPFSLETRAVINMKKVIVDNEVNSCLAATIHP